jgi:CRISPR-associated protein Csm3
LNWKERKKMNDRRSGDEAGPKPYAYVPFPGRVRRSDTTGHDKLASDRYSGRLIFQLRALTPVFVGTGSYALGKDSGFPNEAILRPFYRVAGVPTIPGASLKGVARSIAEAVSPSCITVSRLLPRQLPEGMELTQSRENKCVVTNACPACSLFGHSGQSRDVHANYLGKVSFGDARLMGNARTQLFRLAPLFAPRGAGSPKGRKFYYHSRPAEDKRQPPVEVIPAGQRVEGRIDFENVTAAELGLLFFATGIDGALTLKLGGGKPLGLGSLRVVKAELTLLGTNHYMQAEGQETAYSGEALADFIVEMRAAANAAKILLGEQAKAVAEILTFNEKRLAPEGAY